MAQPRNKVVVSAAVLSLISAVLAGSANAADPKSDRPNEINKKEIERCYGINACKGKGQCGGKGHSCAGLNACKGLGYIHVEKDHCVDVQNGSLKPLEEKKG